MDYGTRLESERGLKAPAGSNPATSANLMNSRMYPRKIFKQEIKRYCSQSKDTLILVEKIMEGKPVGVLELSRKQIVP